MTANGGDPGASRPHARPGLRPGTPPDPPPAGGPTAPHDESGPAPEPPDGPTPPPRDDPGARDAPEHDRDPPPGDGDRDTPPGPGGNGGDGEGGGRDDDGEGGGPGGNRNGDGDGDRGGALPGPGGPDAREYAPGDPYSPDAAGRGTLLDTLRVAVVMLDTSGRVLLWSPLAEEMLGWAGEHIVGRRVGGLFGPAQTLEGPAADGAPPRLRTLPRPGQAEAILAELLRSGRWDGILSLLHRDGHTVQVETRASLLVDGDGRPFVLASMVETSRLRTLEHDLAALDSLFYSSPLGVAIFDRDLRYVRINEALAAMNGLPVADHLGRTVEEIWEGPIADELAALQRAVLATGRPVIDLIALSPRGRGHRSMSYHRLVDRAGRVLGISATVMDVSERVAESARAEQARHRLTLLNEVSSRIAGVLDVGRLSQELSEALVPTFSDYAGVILHAGIADGAELPTVPYRESMALRQLGASAVRWNPAVEQMMGRGRFVDYSAASVFGSALITGEPRLVTGEVGLRATTYSDDPKAEAASELGITSLLVLPLRARGAVLGLLVVSRESGREAFDADDLALGTELADRAGATLDNARLYVREREGALMLQRSLLPQSVTEPPGVEVAFRYVPGSSGAEVGGDWFDVIPLAGGRLAFVVGDVMGHGLRAAATMGRLRTAVRTLAALDMAPDELLRRVNELGDDLAQSQSEGWMATAVYCVYDPSTRRCAIAQAGHLPPLLVERPAAAEADASGQPGSGQPGAGRPESGRSGSGGRARSESTGSESGARRGVPGPPPVTEARLLDLPTGVPLGVGGVRFETTELEVQDGAVLVLYTDGLVEVRGQDIGTGLERMRATMCRPAHSLEDACDELLAEMEPDREPDDVALLMARLGGLPAGSTVSWTFPAEASAVRLARRRVRDSLADWGLSALADMTVLLVSELVTNSLRYAHGPIGVRMVRGSSLLVEVSDPLPDPPRERTAAADDEGGRGLQLVGRTSRRWGTRHGPLGKTVWFELPLP